MRERYNMEHAMSRYLSFASAIFAGLLLLVPAATAVETLTITGSQAIVRAKPGVTHPVLTLAPRGAIFPVLETQGEWYKILLEDGREGWITRAVGRVEDEARKLTEAAPQAAAVPGTLMRWGLVIGNSAYQAVAVPARQPTTATQNATCEPNSIVTGVSGTPSPSTEVFAIRLTPYGAFRAALKSGFSPATTACAAWASIHSKSTWSPAWWNSR